MGDMEGEPDFPALFKNRSKIKLKKKFFQMKNGTILKIKTNRNYYVYERDLHPPQYLALYAEYFLELLKELIILIKRRL